MTGELADVADTAAAEAAAVLRNGRRALPAALSGRMRGRLRRAQDELAITINHTATIVAQARSRPTRQLPDSATRLVSLPDPNVRSIRKGRIDRPLEFGCKAQVIDNHDGVILDYHVQAGNPPLAPAISRIARRTGSAPRSVTADRGYGDPATERELEVLGVHTIAIPRKAKVAPRPPRRRARSRIPALVKWRTGSEGRTSPRLCPGPLFAAGQPQAPPQLRAALTTIQRHIDDRLASARLPMAA